MLDRIRRMFGLTPKPPQPPQRAPEAEALDLSRQARERATEVERETWSALRDSFKSAEDRLKHPR